jgi:molybdopterin-guanine dinucleotide biosynthesis protein A
MIDRVATALSPVTSEVFVVGNADDASQWLPGVRVVRDALEGGGSAAGVHAALRAAAGPVIVVAWDLPFVVTGVLDELVAIGDQGTADAVVPAGVSPGTFEPMCAWYAPSCADAIEREWSHGDRSLHGLIRHVRTAVVPAARLVALGGGLPVFFNVNTDDDLVQARRIAEETGDASTGPA